MSWLFTSGSQNIGALASASVLPMNIQGRFPLGLTGLISLLPKGHSQESSLAPPFKSINSSVFSLLYGPVHLYKTTGKKCSFDNTDLCWQSDAGQREHKTEDLSKGGPGTISSEA